MMKNETFVLRGSESPLEGKPGMSVRICWLDESLLETVQIRFCYFFFKESFLRRGELCKFYKVCECVQTRYNVLTNVFLCVT